MLDKYSESLRGALVKLKKRYPMLEVYEGTTNTGIFTIAVDLHLQYAFRSKVYKRTKGLF